MAPYTVIPILLLFGDYVDQFPRWAPRLVACRAFVEAANVAGGHASVIVLPERGIHGNAHMLMQDRNNMQVADILLDWMNVKRWAQAARERRAEPCSPVLGRWDEGRRQAGWRPNVEAGLLKPGN